ncbi:LysM peptidoglycan-binding domain-containing protein [Arundinibacter roseus]|uniref:LysM peptidoglycan-binding domain-containing protein n=1 Tax=Arundinibacter roseus TaxID=2070510 RepID=A0A4R4K1N9_9BACT|nr:LysM peptidoglycan-binding domain-containing protein [Arundinibacter roseus]TDB61158.1 LysM peptidoglycan-binding domain-containing protein [Arundinibacter roseus]
MKYLFCLALLSCVSTFLSGAEAKNISQRDSIGSETTNGKIFVLHRVDKGQTMYAVMRRYGTSIKAIKDANPGINDQLRADQVIRVPYSGPAPSKSSAKEDRKKKEEKKPEVTAQPSVASGVHTVLAGQTLYSIAVKYGVTMAEIRQWNGLETDNVQFGQELIIAEKTYLERTKNAFPAPPATKDSARVISSPLPERPKKPAAERAAPPKAATGKRLTESGLAEVINTEESSSKYLALHRTAPMGTLIQVKNEYNQETIWVKVVGRIPNTSANEDIVIKLSTRAFEKLSPNSRRFRAEISFISAN